MKAVPLIKVGLRLTTILSSQYDTTHSSWNPRMPLVRNTGSLAIRCFKTVENCADRLTGAAGPVFVAICWFLITSGGFAFRESVRNIHLIRLTDRLPCPSRRDTLPQTMDDPKNPLPPPSRIDHDQPLRSILLRYKNPTREPTFDIGGD